MSIWKGNTIISKTGTSGIQIPLPACYDIKTNITKDSIELIWNDGSSKQYVQNGQKFRLNQWEKTLLIQGTDHCPNGIHDGELLIESLIEGQFSKHGYILENLIPDTLYYFSLIPIDINGVIGTIKKLEIRTKKPLAIYGIKFNSSSIIGERTDDAVGFNVTCAKTLDGKTDTGEQAVNDFDNVYPFNAIETCPDVIQAEGDHIKIARTVVKIPKFAMWANEDFTEIKIAKELANETWWWAPAFVRNDKTIRDWIKITNYNATIGNAYVKESGDSWKLMNDETNPRGTMDLQMLMLANDPEIDTMYNKYRGLKDGSWQTIDYSIWFTLEILWLIVAGNRSVSNFGFEETNAKLVLDSAEASSNVQLIGKLQKATHTLTQIYTSDGVPYGNSFYGIENMFSNLYNYPTPINSNPNNFFYSTPLTGMYIYKGKIYQDKQCNNIYPFEWDASTNSIMPMTKELMEAEIAKGAGGRFNEIGTFTAYNIYNDAAQARIGGILIPNSMKRLANNTYILDAYEALLLNSPDMSEKITLATQSGYGSIWWLWPSIDKAADDEVFCIFDGVRSSSLLAMGFPNIGSAWGSSAVIPVSLISDMVSEISDDSKRLAQVEEHSSETVKSLSVNNN